MRVRGESPHGVEGRIAGFQWCVVDLGEPFRPGRQFGLAEPGKYPGQQGIDAAVGGRQFGGPFEQGPCPGQVALDKRGPRQSHPREARPVVGFQRGEICLAGRVSTTQLREQVALGDENRCVARREGTSLLEQGHRRVLVDFRSGVGGEVGPLEVVRVEPHCLAIAGECRGIQLVGVVDPPEPTPGIAGLAVALEVAGDGVDQDLDGCLHGTRFDAGDGRFRPLFRAPGEYERGEREATRHPDGHAQTPSPRPVPLRTTVEWFAGIPGNRSRAPSGQITSISSTAWAGPNPKCTCASTLER